MHFRLALGIAFLGPIVASAVARVSEMESPRQIVPATGAMAAGAAHPKDVGVAAERASEEKHGGTSSAALLREGRRSKVQLAVARTTSAAGNSAVAWDVALVLLGFTALGMLAAVIARKLDSRVYIASDVEGVLGFAPMAQLPDFREVSKEAAEKHLLRLASGINLAAKERGLKSCVFTGVDAGAGATTLAARTKEMLETLGNLALIVDGSGVRANELSQSAGKGQAANEHDGLAAVLLQYAPEAAALRRGQMVLIDAAPLVTSPETEYLVRQADCAIVVIEAGVTTRAQLRHTANILQRAKAPAVGFVLNRVKAPFADADFRRSLEQSGGSEKKDSHLEDEQTLETLRFAVELGRASLEPEGVLAEDGPGSLKREMEPAAASAERMVEPTSNAAGARVEPVTKIAQGDGAQALNDMPWWLAEAPPRADSSLTQPRIPRNGRVQPATNGVPASEHVQEAMKQIAEDGRPVRLPRLTDLRGSLFATGIRELDSAKHGDGNGHGNGDERFNEEVAPLEALLGEAEKQKNSMESQGAEAESAQGFLAPPEENGTAARNGSPVSAAPRPQLFLPKPAKPIKTKPHQDARQPIDRVEILPSRRGQYKRKG